MLAEQELRKHGIKLILGNGVKEFVSLDDKHQEVRLADGQAVTANLVVLAMGVRPDTGFLADSDIKLGDRGHILVNEFMETNAKDV